MDLVAPPYAPEACLAVQRSRQSEGFPGIFLWHRRNRPKFEPLFVLAER